MLDLNNRPGGPNLIVTAKTAHKVHFLDAETLTLSKTIDMPGSTHELALSADGRTAYGSVYGDGIFIKRVNPDRRIVVIDLPSQSLSRVIDLGQVYAPHGVMMDKGRGVVLGRAWQCGAGHRSRNRQGAADRCRQHRPLGRDQPRDRQGVCLGQNQGCGRGRRRPPRGHRSDQAAAVTEGLAISPDGATLYVCAQTAPEFYAIDARSHAVHQTVAIDEANPINPQMRRVRVSPDNRYVVVSSNKGEHAAIYTSDGLKRIASFPTKKSPMGFGFAPDGEHAYLCCHDDAVVFEFELKTGAITRTFPTEAGCEFIVAYH